jgi:hypothetical protein
MIENGESQFNECIAVFDDDLARELPSLEDMIDGGNNPEIIQGCGLSRRLLEPAGFRNTQRNKWVRRQGFAGTVL